jgi:glutathione peroxidase-family protein
VKVEMRWLRSRSRRSNGSQLQRDEYGEEYYTLQFRYLKGIGVDGEEQYPLWSDWEDVQVKDDRSW